MPTVRFDSDPSRTSAMDDMIDGGYEKGYLHEDPCDGEVVMSFGRYKGRHVSDMMEDKWYLNWVLTNGDLFESKWPLLHAFVVGRMQRPDEQHEIDELAREIAEAPYAALDWARSSDWAKPFLEDDEPVVRKPVDRAAGLAALRRIREGRK